ncbi:MAG: nucleotidyltransferase domain-containing protein [Candidatus Nezhaarchaeales archaeon]
MRSQRLFEIRREALEALRRLAKEINATIYLFGSYARGDYTLESDVDVIVVCECFKGMKYIDRIEFVRMKLPRDMGFDLIALTPKELKDKMKYSFFKDISSYWIEIKP